MAVPNRVREEARAAEAQLAEIARAAAAPAPAETPPANDQPASTAPDPGANPVGATVVPGPTAPAAPAPPEIDYARLLSAAEQRERSLQGMFNKQAEQLQLLQRQLDQLIKEKEQPKPAAPPTKLITDEDVKEYGDETIDMVRRVFRESMAGVMGPLDNRIAAIERALREMGGKVEHASAVVHQTAEDKFWAAVDAALPNFDAVNNDPRMLDWLGKADTISGVVRHKLLTEAHTKLDAARVIAIFKQGMADAGIGAPAADAAKGSSTVDLATLATPGAGAQSTSPASGQRKGKVWTAAEVEKVYDDRMRGRSTPEQFAKDEADIMKAMTEGRYSG